MHTVLIYYAHLHAPVMWSEAVGLSTTQKIGLGLGLAGVVLCCETSDGQ